MPHQGRCLCGGSTVFIDADPAFNVRMIISRVFKSSHLRETRFCVTAGIVDGAMGLHSAPKSLYLQNLPESRGPTRLLTSRYPTETQLSNICHYMHLKKIDRVANSEEMVLHWLR